MSNNPKYKTTELENIKNPLKMYEKRNKIQKKNPSINVIDELKKQAIATPKVSSTNIPLYVERGLKAEGATNLIMSALALAGGDNNDYKQSLNTIKYNDNINELLLNTVNKLKQKGYNTNKLYNELKIVSDDFKNIENELNNSINNNIVKYGGNYIENNIDNLNFEKYKNKKLEIIHYLEKLFNLL